MNASPPSYTKLPGVGYRSTTSFIVRFALFFVIGLFVLLLRGKRVQLWLAGDHLLVVDSDGYSEDYKRYYFKDIQGITFRRTIEGKMINVLLALPIVIFCLWAIGDSEPGLFIVALFFLPFLVINIVRGPTCETELFTAIQSEKLPSLDRIKNVRKVLAKLQPLILAAQGELKAEEIPAVRGASTFGPSVEAVVLPPAETTYRGRTHLILSWVALSDLLGTLIVTTSIPSMSRLYTLIMMASVGILSLIAINEQKNTTLPIGLKRLPVLLLAALGAGFLASMAFTIYYAISDPATVAAMQEDTLTASWQVVLMTLSTGFNAVAGLYGVIHFRRYREKSKDAPPPMPPLMPNLPA